MSLMESAAIDDGISAATKLMNGPGASDGGDFAILKYIQPHRIWDLLLSLHARSEQIIGIF